VGAAAAAAVAVALEVVAAVVVVVVGGGADRVVAEAVAEVAPLPALSSPCTTECRFASQGFLSKRSTRNTYTHTRARAPAAR
jgi:hypothetical protein